MVVHPVQRARHCHPAALPDEEPLLLREPPGHLHRRLVRYAHVVVEQGEIHVAGEDILSDALGEIRVDLGLVERAPQWK